jgi:uncharacterized membrane protein (UPF0127 family)
MKIAERIVLVVLLLGLLGAVVYVVYFIQRHDQKIRDGVERGDYEIRTETATTSPENWRVFFPELIPIVVASTTVQASVADSIGERIKGLSDTPYLPEGVVKLFAFGDEGEQAIWMKDMNYSIDILWVAEEGKIVHIEQNISPDTYPTSFKSPIPAFYVIEANAGFVASSSIRIGDEVILPKLR